MTTTRDIRLPAESILALRRSLVREVGREAAIRALQEAGNAAGDQIAHAFPAGSGDPGAVPEDTFWDRLSDQFRELGWGSVEHSSPHPGVGALVARDWFEIGEDSRACPFTTGVLANLLGNAADGEVAVLQVVCDDGSPRCARFLFGAPAVLDRLYSDVRETGDVESSLAGLR